MSDHFRDMELERKARAHDDYRDAVAAVWSRSARIRAEARGYTPAVITAGVDDPVTFAAGYTAALRDLSEAVLHADRVRESLKDPNAPWLYAPASRGSLAISLCGGLQPSDDD